MLSQGDLEFIALNSDMDGDFSSERPSPQMYGQSAQASTQLPLWQKQKRRRVTVLSVGVSLLLVFVVALVIFQEQPVPAKLSQAKPMQAWESSSDSNVMASSSINADKAADDSSSSTSAAGSSETAAWAAAAQVAEAASASWDLDALPCRCNCPDGTSPQPPPPRDKIIQSASDARQHRSVMLPGGLRAFLTSDPATDFAAAAVDVGAGSADDPKDFQGLAHFLEHMLFMGSEKYPEEDGYSKFLTQNGGYDNAFTAEEHTNFFLKVRATALPEALDRFAQILTAPLLPESAASREVMAVDAEHHKNLNNDAWRLNQVLVRECGGRPAHFGTGDRDTLRNGSTEVVEAMRNFHSKNYVAENLRLSILGKESLDDLEKTARSVFEHVRRGKAPTKSLSALPGPPEGICAGGSAYIVRPLGDMQSLVLSFPAREMRSEEAQRSAAISIITFIVAGRHEGSLYADLKKRGWATSVDFGIDVNMADISTLELSVELTGSGLAAYLDVVDVALGHLRLAIDALEAYARSLKTPTSAEARRARSASDSSSEVCSIWSDMEAISALNFHFKENSDPAGFVSNIASTLRNAPPRDVLGSSAATTLDADFSMSIIKALDSRHKTPTLWIYAKDFDGGHGLRDALKETTEPIYGTTYFKGHLPAALESRWLGDLPLTDAQLPAHSAEFLPQHLTLQPVPTNGAGRREAAPEEVPVSKKDLHYHVFYKGDAEYRVPKALVHCLASTAPQSAAAAAVETQMLAVALSDALEVPLYHAGLAGYGWAISPKLSGLEISVGGYSGGGLEDLADRLAAAITDPPALPAGRFEALLDLQRRSTKSQHHRDLYSVGRSYLSAQALSTPAWSWGEELTALDSVTWDAVVKRGKAIRSESALTCGAIGDASKVRALALADKLASVLSLKQLPLENSPLPGVVALPKKADFTEMRAPALVAGESNSLVILVYQIEPASCPRDKPLCPEALHQAATMLLLSQVASQKAFNQLRTKESLGYVVFAWVQPSAVEEAGGKTVWSLRMLVQSGVKSAAYVKERMTKFLDGFLDELQASNTETQNPENTVTDADIDQAKDGLVAALRKRPDSLAEESQRLWTEVQLRRYDFSRPWKLAQIVPTLSRKDCAEVLEQVMQPGKAGRRAAIEVWSAKDGDPFPDSAIALHLDNAAAMQEWKEKIGTWSSEL